MKPLVFDTRARAFTKTESVFFLILVPRLPILPGATRTEDPMVDGDRTGAAEQNTDRQRPEAELGGGSIELDQVQAERADLLEGRPGGPPGGRFSFIGEPLRRCTPRLAVDRNAPTDSTWSRMVVDVLFSSDIQNFVTGNTRTLP